jgi:WD40 repeat protein
MFDISSSSIQMSKQIQLPVPGVSRVLMRPDQKLYASAGWDHRVRLFSAKGRPLAALAFHSESVSALAFPQLFSSASESVATSTALDITNQIDGMMLSASKDGKIACWHVYPSNA